MLGESTDSKNLEDRQKIRALQRQAPAEALRRSSRSRTRSSERSSQSTRRRLQAPSAFLHEATTESPQGMVQTLKSIETDSSFAMLCIFAATLRLRQAPAASFWASRSPSRRQSLKRKRPRSRMEHEASHISVLSLSLSLPLSLPVWITYGCSVRLWQEPKPQGRVFRNLGAYWRSFFQPWVKGAKGKAKAKDKSGKSAGTASSRLRTGASARPLLLIAAFFAGKYEVYEEEEEEAPRLRFF